MTAAKGQHSPEEKFRPRIEAAEGELPELGNFLAGHGMGDESRPLVSKIAQIAGHGSVFVDVIIEIGARKGREGMEIGDIGIEIASELDGL